MTRTEAIDLIATYQKWPEGVTTKAEAVAHLQYLSKEHAIALAKELLRAAECVGCAIDEINFSGEIPEGSTDEVAIRRTIELLAKQKEVWPEFLKIRGLWSNHARSIQRILDSQST